MQRRACLRVAGAGIFAVAGLGGCQRVDHNKPQAQLTALGTSTPFEYTLLDGTPAHSTGLVGQVVLVNFWATTCAVCVAEMPELVALHQALGPLGLRTLAVAVQNDPPALVAHFAQTRQLPTSKSNFDVVIDNRGAVAKAFGSVVATPTTFVLNRQGQWLLRIEGRPNFAQLHSVLAGLLA